MMKLPSDAPRQTVTPRAVRSPWVWMTVTCLILGISGGIRFWRERQFTTLAVESEASPFPLRQLPGVLGTWQVIEGSQVPLDPEIARIAGSSDHIQRRYLEEKTGEQAWTLILYGLAAQVFGHTPDACYPSAGYQLIKGPLDRSITVPGVKDPVRYHWAIYAKRDGALSRYEESFFTFRYNGEWVPDVSNRWKQFRYHPGLFKVQIARAVTTLNEPGESPGESLLIEIVRQINDRLSPGASGRDDSPSPTALGLKSPG
jgi:Protein of unknown function (DUF3485)